jgi:hypothetical protein
VVGLSTGAGAVVGKASQAKAVVDIEPNRIIAPDSAIASTNERILNIASSKYY